MKAVKVTENYKAVLEGRLAKGEFVRQMRLQFPNIVTKFNGYDDTVQILKNKQMIFDAPINEAFENVKVYDDRPALTYSLNALERGIGYELTSAGIMAHDKFNIKAEDYFKAEQKAKSNLDKDANHYLNLLSGESSKVDKHDREEEIKRGEGKIDVFNGLKKANLKEVKELLKEGELDRIAAKYGVDVDRLKKFADQIKALELKKAGEDARKLSEVEKIMTSDIVEEAPEMSEDAKKATLGKVVGELRTLYPIITPNIVKEFIRKNYQNLLEGSDTLDLFEKYIYSLEEVKESNQEESIADFIINYYKNPKTDKSLIDDEIINDFFNTHPESKNQENEEALDNFKEYLSVNYGGLDEKKVNEDVDYHIELLVPEVAFDVESGDLADSPYEFGTEDEIEDGDVDVTTYTDGDELDEFVFGRSYKQAKHFEKTYPGLFKVVTKVSEKKGKDHDGDGDVDGDDYMHAKDKAIKKAMGKDEQLKEAIKTIIKKTLNDKTLNEAATNGLASLSDQYDGLKGFKTAVIDLQNLVTEIESFNDRMKDKIQGVFNKTGDIENEDGLKVGAFLAPTIMGAFKKDLGPVMKGGYMKNIELPKTTIFKRPEPAMQEMPKQTIYSMNEDKGHNQYMKVDEGHCNEIMEKLKEKYASEGIKFSKKGKDTINAGHCTEGKMKKMISEMEKEGYKVHESSCNSN